MKTKIGYVFFWALLFLANLTDSRLLRVVTTSPKVTTSLTPQERPGLVDTCKSKLLGNSNAPSGVYDISLSNGYTIKVYCEMGLNGGGYTFLSPASLPYITSQHLASWFTDTTSFLMRVRKTNGTQPYAVLNQLPEYASVPLKLGLNEFDLYTEPVNLNVIGAPYLYYGFLPISQVNQETVQGLTVNGVRVAFTNCDNNPNNQFTLFPNFNEVLPSIKSVPGRVCNSIFSNVKPNPSGRVMPAAFFMFGETHWGGCGCYVQSNQQSDILSWSIGFR